MNPKRGDQFNVSFLNDICFITAVRRGTVYFRSGNDKYQMPLDTFNSLPIKSSHPLAEAFAWNESRKKSVPLTERELLIAGFAYRCCEKGDNIQQMEYLLRKMFEQDKNAAS